MLYRTGPLNFALSFVLGQVTRDSHWVNTPNYEKEEVLQFFKTDTHLSRVNFLKEFIRRTLAKELGNQRVKPGLKVMDRQSTEEC
jgi:hypothetical protein